MNFFDAVLKKEGEDLIVDAGIFKVTIPPMFKERYDKYAGREIVFGIRPENIHDPNYQPADTVTALVEANVDVVELMGNEMIVYFQLDGKTFLGRLDPRTDARVGMKMSAAFDMANIHLFDAKTDETLY